MNPDRDFDDQLDGWLENGPEDAPDELLANVLREFPSIPQRRAGGRAPWARLVLHRSARLLAGVAAGATLLIVGFAALAAPSLNLGSSSAPASPTIPAGTAPSPSSIDTTVWPTFTSSRYGFTIRYPTGWAVAPARTSWQTGSLLPNTVDSRAPAPMLDTFSSPDGPFFAGGSQPMPRGVTSEGWLTTYEAAGAATVPSKECWPPPALMGRTMIDGVSAWVREGCGATDAIAFAGGRVYIFRSEIDPTLNRRLFDAFLSTVNLMPASGAGGS